jgi:hypothetical protein
LKIAQKAMDDLNLAPELTLLSAEKGIAYQFANQSHAGGY